MTSSLSRELTECRIGWNTFLRSLFALILREARVRHGRSRIGYAWAVLEPFAVTAVMIFFFAGLGLRGRSADFAPFYASGILAFAYFRHASSFVAMAIESNTPLFSYPRVREMDAALARLILDTVTSILICTLVLGFLYFIFGVDMPHDIGRMLIAYFGLGFLALGVGLNVASLQRRFQMAAYVYNMVMTPALILSCVFFTLESLPYEFRHIIAWNPIVHGVEGFRSGYLRGFPDQYVSLGYLYFVGLLLTFTGMVQLILSKRGML